jgi:hypothetical protein
MRFRKGSEAAERRLSTSIILRATLFSGLFCLGKQFYPDAWDLNPKYRDLNPKCRDLNPKRLRQLFLLWEK